MQFFVFMICALCGLISGVVYDLLYVARCIVCGTNKTGYTAKDRIFIIASDLLYCAVFAAGYIFTSVMFNFEGVRLYMLIGCIFGAFIYLKSFHIIVAFLCNKVYNKIIKLKEKNGGTTKTASLSGGVDGQRDNFTCNSRGGDNLSASDDSVVEKANRQHKKRNRKIRNTHQRGRKRPKLS